MHGKPSSATSQDFAFIPILHVCIGTDYFLSPSLSYLHSPPIMPSSLGPRLFETHDFLNVPRDIVTEHSVYILIYSISICMWAPQQHH